MLDYAFTALGLHSVMLIVDEFNLAGRRAYEKAGFREFGRRRQCHWIGGRLLGRRLHGLPGHRVHQPGAGPSPRAGPAQNVTPLAPYRHSTP